MTKQSDRIRAHVQQLYVQPARKKRMSEVRINAGEVHRDLGLYNSVPSVCQALRSQKFQTENRLTLVRFEGPPSGLSTTSTFTFALETVPDTPVESSRLANMFGVGREAFKKEGGGEKYLKSERSSWRKSR